MRDKTLARTFLTELDFDDADDREKAAELMNRVKDLMRQMPHM